MHEQMVPPSPVHLVYLVAHKDEAWRKRLNRHLRPLRRQGRLSTWSVQQVAAGTDWQREVEKQITNASIIVLLVSSDFLANDACSHMMEQALTHSRARLLPVLLRPVDWELSLLTHLSHLPRNGKPMSQQPDQDAALQEIAREIYTCIDPQGAARLSPLSPAPRFIDQDCQYFQTRLKTRYRKVQERSLQGVALIALRLHSQPDAVMPPEHLTFRNLNLQTEQPLPSGTSITQVYDETDGGLLILGKPGAGKSTLLLQLAQQLLARAEQDEQHFLPVIVNLSSWGQKRQSLSDWLVEELRISYQVPCKFGHQWVQTGRLLLLLDGLDEVANAARSACIDAIHVYRRNHQVPLVVCCRTAEYSAQQQRLALQQAIVVQPLTMENIYDYLERAGSALAGLYRVLKQNRVLQELITTPLMLNVMALTYQHSPAATVPEVGSLEELRQKVFANYVLRMFVSNRIDQHAPMQCFLARLAWLARQMRQHGQTIFYLEQLQPSWLSSPWTLVYHWLAVRLLGIILGILVTPAVDQSLNSGYTTMPFKVSILLGGLLGGLLSGGRANQYLIGGEDGAKNVPWLRWLLQFLVSGLICLGIALSYEQTNQPNSGLSLDLRLVLTPGPSFLLGILLLQFLLENKSRVQLAHLTKQTVWQFIRTPEVRNGFLVGGLVWLSLGLGYLLFEMPFGLSYALNAGLIYGLSHGLNYGLSFGLSSSLLSILLIRRSTEIQPTDRLDWSWTSLKESLFSKSHISMALQVSACIGLILGLSSGLITGLSSKLSNGLNFGIVSEFLIHMFSEGLSGGLSNGLIYGVSFWFLFGLFQSVSSKTIPDHERNIPNEGIRSSACKGLWLGFISTVFVGLSYVLSVGLSYVLRTGLESNLRYEDLSNGLGALNYGLNFALGDGLNAELSAGLLVGLSLGLLVWFYHGGLAYLRHYILRLLLRLSESNPWNYVRFLNQATSCIFLLQVGGGYYFIHHLFLDYIADHSTHLHMNEQNQTATREDSAVTGND